MAKTTKPAKTIKSSKKSKTTEPDPTPPASGLSAKRRLNSFKSVASKRILTRTLRRETQQTKVANSFVLFWRALGMFRRHWNVLGGVLLIYAILNLVLVGGLNGGGDLQQTRDALSEVFTGTSASLSAGVTLFTFLVTSGTGTMASGIASAYQTVLLILVSLAVIWALRQLYAGHTIRIRDCYYRSMAPLIPFVLVMVVVGLQLLPLLAASFLFNALINGGLLIVFWQQVLACIVCLALGCLTIYWLCSSLLALYVVTLPDMTPWKAIVTARDIVKFRRALVLRKILFLPLAIIVVMGLVMVPLAAFLTIAAIPVFFLLTVVTLGVVHSYMYALYRELIA